MASRPPQARIDTSDVPLPTTKAPRGATIRRAKTLTRPERGQAPPPLINPSNAVSAAALAAASAAEETSAWDPWVVFSRVVTFWAPAFLLSSLGGMKDPQVQQAWREKCALVFIIMCLCAVIGFATVGLQKVLCPENSTATGKFSRLGRKPGVLGVNGYEFDATGAAAAGNVNFKSLYQQLSGQDITPYFQRSAASFPACRSVDFRVAKDEPCNAAVSCPLPPLNASSTLPGLGLKNNTVMVGYDWGQVGSLNNYFVLDGAVLNMVPYFQLHKNPVPGDRVDAVLRTIMSSGSKGKDGTRLFYNRADLQRAVPCLQERYYAGNIDKVTPGCFVANLVLYAGLIVIMGLILIRFFMAIVFDWFLSSRLAGDPDSRTLNRNAISPAVLPEGANISIDNRNGTAPWAGPEGGKRLAKPPKGGKDANVRSTASSTSTLVNGEAAPTTISMAQIGAELFSVCLVTCYSEGEDSLRTTLDSISTTTYADERKLLFVVADGMITGAGEKRSTPDICVSLLEADPRFGNPQPMAYLAVGSGSKKENRAMVYAGHYTVAGRRTPTVMIIKCGTEAEAATDKKPGNRGKRDSQLILMNFFSRVTFNDRMTPLDYDLFRKIHILMGVTPDFFEVVLMVDADTKVFPESLKHLVNCMQHDQMIMGVCGETRIANKRQSWITAIQVFEYFISHHLAKAFESVFGGVTCLPGCFSMFRLKARKSSGDDWVPLIIKPEIVNQYSQSVVTTLHQKNLLLLGEDRFLTTLLIRTFPNRKMMFLPQARCRTVVPDTFKMLLSQRRRWINSTIHNLMELVLVRNLCGTFCFSMQFIVFMDLIGTVVLPIAISLTYMLIVSTALNPPKSFSEAIPLILLVGVLGLPAILIMITTRKVVYVAWMFIYLLSLPVWNFILPVYAFWHFDDFSWGETRKVEGETKGEAHGEGTGIFDGSSVPLRRWEDWERSRLRKMRRQERRRRELERAHPGGFVGGDRDYLAAPGSARTSQYDGSDTYSLASSDDDHWGGQIGGYNENSMQYPPPPVGLYAAGGDALAGSTLGGSDLEQMLEMGFDDSPTQTPTGHKGGRLPPGAPRFHLNDGKAGYSPLSRSTSPGPNSALSPTSPSTPRRDGEKYGPLGPLDPDSR